ncbi:hypothetical protein ABZ468_16535 [Streptomyces sp. NPDC005708]|uniref:hypothetical protein n=1 Tax=unclassified Streptomyces TaxID=2593676 RepID=UPI0033C87B9C
MPADEVTHGTDVDASRVRTGPRHAAPKKPLFTRFHMPAGKAIAMAAMPTAVFMGVGLNATFARADDHPAKSMSVDEYQKCVEAVDGSKDSSSSPSPSASASASESAGTAQPTPSASPGKTDSSPGKTSSSDSGSDDKVTPKPSASSTGTSGKPSGGGTPTPSASQGGGLLGTLGDAIGGVLTGGSSTSTSATPTPSASSASSTKETAKDTASTTVKDTTKQLTDTVNKTVKDTTDTATKTVSDATKAAGDAVKSVESAVPSVSASPSVPDDCVAATDDEGGVEKIVALPDAPWHLQASSLTLRGADYQGVVKVRTANGTVKKVLKYVISDGTDIGDLHQLVDGDNGKTYHVQAGKGTTSTIRDGKTVMYTESISGNLLGLIPITFSPDSPPPLNIPFIYFTNVKVTQAGQFGGTLTVPGMQQYVTG